MTHEEVEKILNEIHKNKYYTPIEEEQVFLNDLSFFVTIGNIKISEKQAKTLKKIQKKSQELSNV